ncbi:MAG: NifU N-terminal domain-containing protein [Flavobacteriaceae bacterium]|nr:NifU N-terminal domain-containing protein [Flavobacteriaceae bacterium]MCY4267799.1 NifU N-terminal domain-containing protein [Flavobacteriaceae bacterium]
MKKIEITSKVEKENTWAVFYSNVPIGPEEVQTFENIDHTTNAPLAAQLFYLPFVKKVKIGRHEIHVERFDILEWSEVNDEVAQQIQDYLNDGGTVIKSNESSKLPISVYAESTPNPKAMKFVANKPLVDQTYEFKSVQHTHNAPLAEKLFEFDYVEEVFFDSNYISIQSNQDWNLYFTPLREFIKDYLESGNPVINGPIDSQYIVSLRHQKELSDIEKEIVDILDNYVRPAVAADGGNIAFDTYNQKDKILSLILQGACSGCPSSTYTLKMGIENMMKQMLPGKVKEVVAING